MPPPPPPFPVVVVVSLPPAPLPDPLVVPVAELRAWLECLVESAWQSAGYRRTKNPRIWSMHDLELLAGGGQ